MKRNQRAFLFLFLVSISFVTNSHAQESIVAAGGKGTGDGGAASYSIGQIADVKLKGNGGSAQQGIQQAYEISTLSNDKFEGISLVMTAFPNPVVDELNLIVNNKFEDLSYNLFDINGRILSKAFNITSSETKISMQGLAQGIYFLTVNNNSKAIKTFKIIKK
ncbi:MULTISPECIES: T9SS type A sorting domain-containing protein [Flavobacterium]|uniref:T9SS type A sorting domain-containing protein n=1 Tax=Flavobacterium TaxID=237 RepID=UPI001182D080|nr:MULTISPECIES: T9SS type A sorting domain-containing protein [Flavobacterium]MCR4029983.1 T9SS type A sorting domain-containing protein [Flavobacterium panacis]